MKVRLKCVLVRKGKNGKEQVPPGTVVDLPAADARRMIGLGTAEVPEPEPKPADGQAEGE